MTRARRLILLAYGVLFLGTALIAVKPGGDCGEYILMARAFAAHATPEVRESDATWLARRERRLAGVARHHQRGVARDKENTSAGSRALSGRYYSIHFWFYSLLAAPVLVLLELVGGPPLLALTTVNAAAGLLAAYYAWRQFQGTWIEFVAPGVFLLAGATFYLAFTGPELLTASGVFIAALAAARGQLGIGFLATGISATQNPSAAGMFAFVAFETWRYRRSTRKVAGTLEPVVGHRTLELGAAGLLLAVLPYVFFQVEFGVPSLIGKYATDLRLIGGERLWSLFFDLNQGMAFGLPGLFVGLAAILLVPKPRAEGGWPVRVAVTVATVVVMALPTLATHNWNAGAVVFMRYAYWLAMPLLALLLGLAAGASVRTGGPVILAFAALQASVFVLNGFRGEDSSYLRHGWVARTVLAHAPAAYSPVAEVFVERSLGRETAPRESVPVVWPRHGAPQKILLHESAPPLPAPECPAGTQRVPSTFTVLWGGWEYQSGPFSCEPATPP